MGNDLFHPEYCTNKSDRLEPEPIGRAIKRRPSTISTREQPATAPADGVQYNTADMGGPSPSPPQHDVDKLVYGPPSHLAGPFPAPEPAATNHDAEPTRARWSYKRLPAPGNEDHRYGTEDTLAVGDRLEISVTPQNATAKVDSRFDGPTGVVVPLLGPTEHGRGHRLLYMAQLAGAGTIHSSATDPDHAPSPHDHHVRVINLRHHHQTRLAMADTEIFAQYVTAEQWMYTAAENYKDAKAAHDSVLKDAKSSSRLFGELLWAAVTSALGLSVKGLIVKFATSLTAVARDNVGEVVKDSIGGAPSPDGGSGYSTAGVDPYASFLRAGAGIAGQAKRLTAFQQKMEGEASAKEQAGEGNNAEFEVDPLTALFQEQAISAELYGSLQSLSSEPPSALDFEKALWTEWVLAYAWQVADDGAETRHVRVGEDEYTEVTQKFSAEEDFSEKIHHYLQVIGMPEREIAGLVRISERSARDQAARSQRTARTSKMNERRH